MIPQSTICLADHRNSEQSPGHPQTGHVGCYGTSMRSRQVIWAFSGAQAPL